jgi:hypothetical protein
MTDRLFVTVLGHRKSGKSTTWNTLFGRTVHTGKQSRMLELLPGECVEVFLISGSNEEREQYAGDVLEDQAARIILCSVQYVETASATIEYISSFTTVPSVSATMQSGSRRNRSIHMVDPSFNRSRSASGVTR